MSRKMLYILNIANRVNNFSYTSMIAAKFVGFEYHIAGNWSYKSDDDRRADEEKYGIHIHQVDFIRTPYHPGNIKSYKQLARIVKKERFDVIHCNTPIGGILGRLAGKKCKVKKVIYQAHGFHFYKGAPKINWLLYYPVEKWLAHYTDALITINREDYQLAQKKMKLRRGGKVYYVPGVGIDTSLYDCIDSERIEKRRSLGLHENDIAIISTGDLIRRKNFEVSIRAFAKMKVASAQYYICGEGPDKENLKKLAVELNVSDRVHFLGFRSDIKQLLSACDIFLFTSRQEGLSRSLMEAMASGLPCVASRIRGNTDLFEGIEAGSLFEPDDIDSFAERLNSLASDPVLRDKAGKANLVAIQKFSTETVKNKLIEIYNREMGGVIEFHDFIASLLEFYPVWAKKRMELNIPLDSFVLISVGELNSNKNNTVVISAMQSLARRDIQYVLCGTGEYEDLLHRQVDETGLQEQVHFLGYRNDIKELYRMADCFIMPSFREGLSRSIMEAMASGLPCVVSKIRGNVDLIQDEGGFLCSPNDVGAFASAIRALNEDGDLCYNMGAFNKKKVKEFDVSVVSRYLERIYSVV